MAGAGVHRYKAYTRWPDLKPLVRMSFDEEVERINRKKFEDLIRRRAQAEEPRKEVSKTPVELLDSDFHQVVGREDLMVVDFWAPWCSPCRIVSPVIEELASEYAGVVKFGKINVDDNPRISNEFGIQSIPTIVIFQNGKPVDGMVGVAPKSQIESRIRPYIGGSRPAPSPYQ